MLLRRHFVSFSISAKTWLGCGNRLWIALLMVCAVGAGVSDVSAQVVRTKKPDRGVYRPPTISIDSVDSIEAADRLDGVPQPESEKPSALAKLVRSQPNRTVNAKGESDATGSSRSAAGSLSTATNQRGQSRQPAQPRGGPLFATELGDAQASRNASIETVGHEADRETMGVNSTLQRVNHDEVVLTRPGARVMSTQQTDWAQPQETWTQPEEIWDGDGEVIHPGGHASFAGGSCGCDACGGGYRDSGSCDSIGCGGCSSCGGFGRRSFGNGRICLDRNQWFGSVELLLMFRDGITLPSLVTTGGTDSATAGELGQATTRFLVGNENAFDDMSVGGRLTLGTWLDSSQCRSLVFRGWFGGRLTYDFNTDSSRTPTIVRPFLNVTDGQTPAQDNNLIAFPGRSNGDIRVDADSNVYGGDIAVRQYWTGGLGATLDVLYGYQYMGLDESLTVATNSVAIAVPNTPVGTVQSVRDSFQADNEFHGGQFGLALRYQENCWTFNGLIKTGFGSLRRTATLGGQTTNTVGTDVATANEGFLVQSTNSGKRTDHTFGWVPELDLTLGWHRYRRFDVTAGYHVVAMTDALRVFDTVDPNLAVNSALNPTGQLRPAFVPNYETFFVHGIHFGLQYHY